MISRFSLLGLCLFIGGLSGCATGGAALPFMSSGHELMETTDQFRRRVAQPAPVPRELQKATMAPHLVQPGDVLLIEPTSFDSSLRLPADQTVMVDGRIDIGEYGRLSVVGMSIPQIEERVQTMIDVVEQQRALERAAEAEEDEDEIDEDEDDWRERTRVNVRLIQADSALYYVLGEVNQPGSFPLIGRETVLDGLLAAGGLTTSAEKYEIIVSRPSRPGACRQVLPVCYDEIVQLGDTTTNYQLMPGDRIFISTRSCLDQLAPSYKKKKKKVCCSPQRPCCDGGSYCPPKTQWSECEVEFSTPAISSPASQGGSLLLPDESLPQPLPLNEPLR